MRKDISAIPRGPYCYAVVKAPTKSGRMRVKVCPYWSRKPGKPGQMDGHCAYLGKGDWESKATSLLWDQVKECGIKED